MYTILKCTAKLKLFKRSKKNTGTVFAPGGTILLKHVTKVSKNMVESKQKTRNKVKIFL